jgi:hypothetical protein
MQVKQEGAYQRLLDMLKSTKRTRPTLILHGPGSNICLIELASVPRDQWSKLVHDATRDLPWSAIAFSSSSDLAARRIAILDDAHAADLVCDEHGAEEFPDSEHLSWLQRCLNGTAETPPIVEDHGLPKAVTFEETVERAKRTVTHRSKYREVTPQVWIDGQHGEAARIFYGKPDEDIAKSARELARYVGAYHATYAVESGPEPKTPSDSRREITVVAASAGGTRRVLVYRPGTGAWHEPHDVLVDGWISDLVGNRLGAP